MAKEGRRWGVEAQLLMAREVIKKNNNINLGVFWVL